MSDSPPDRPAEFAKALERFRRTTLDGVGKAEFAGRVGVSRQSVHAWLTGGRLPGVRTFQAILELTDDSAAQDELRRAYDRTRSETDDVDAVGVNLAREFTRRFMEGLAVIDTTLPEALTKQPHIPPKLPEEHTVIHGAADIFGHAIRLLIDTPSADTQRPWANDIIIRGRSWEGRHGDELPESLHDAFDLSVAGVLDRGWSVTHALDALELDILKLFDRVGLAGTYRPMLFGPNYQGATRPLDDRVGSLVPDLLAVRGTGVLLVPGSQPAAALYYPWGTEREACEALFSYAKHYAEVGPASEVFSVYRTLYIPARDEDVTAQHVARPTVHQVSFDAELTDAEEADGDRVLLKAGPSVATLPIGISDRQLDRWLDELAKDTHDPEQTVTLHEVVEKLRQQRRRRHLAFNEQIAKHLHRELFPEESIVRWLQADISDAAAWELGPLYSAWGLTQEHRIDHLRYLVSLLRDESVRYHIGLTTAQHVQDIAKVDLASVYWAAKRSTGTQAGSVFFVAHRDEPHGSRRQFQGVVRAPEVVEAFFDDFNKMWAALPDEKRDRRPVADWIERQIEDVALTL